MINPWQRNQRSRRTSTPIGRWHKTYIKRISQRLGLSKYQMLWITFGKGLLIGYFLAFLVHR